MKRSLIVVLTIAVLLFAFAGLAVAADSAEESADRLFDLGFIEGYTDGSFGLENNITRAEFAKIAVISSGFEDAADLLVNSPSQFSDVKSGVWYSGWINVAASQGFVKGDPAGTFRPNDQIRASEVVTVLLRVLGYNDNLPGAWPTNYLVKAAGLGITSGIAFDASGAIERGKVFQMLSKTLDEDVVEYDHEYALGFRSKNVSLLEDALDLVKVNAYVTDIPRTSNLDDDEIEIGGTTYDLKVAVDYEKFFGTKVTAYVNDDDEVLSIKLHGDNTIVYDALEDIDEDELTAVAADKDYDFADEDDVVAIWINGEEEDVDELDGNVYDYAKVVLNKDNDVVFVDAYQWDNFLVVEELDGYDVIGYDEELDAEDYTIVKDGMTITLDELEEGDILFYNEDAEYAEVFNMTVEGEMEEVFESNFEVAGESFEYDTTYDGKAVQYFNEDGDIDDFDKDAAEEMQEAEEDVVVFIDRNGDAVFVAGELGEVSKTTIGAVLYEDMVGYKDSRNKVYAELKVVNENGTVVTYDFNLNDLEAIEVDGDEEWNDDAADLTLVGSAYPYTAIDADAYGNLNLPTMGDVIEITLDDNGDIVELGFFVSDVDNTFAKTYESGDTYIEGKRMSSSVPVFIVDTAVINGWGTWTDSDWDDEDVEVITYGELEEDVDLKSGAITHDGSKVLYLVLTDSDMQKTTTELAILTQVRRNSDGELTRIKALVGDDEITYYIDDPKTDSQDFKAGEAVVLEIIDSNGNVKAIEDVVGSGYEGPSFTVTSSFKDEVVARDREVKDWKLVADGYIYDVSDTTDIELMTFSELRSAEVGTTVQVVYDAEDTEKYVRYFIVDPASTSGGSGSVTGAEVTGLSGTVLVVKEDGVTTSLDMSADVVVTGGTLSTGDIIDYQLGQSSNEVIYIEIKADN
ncbi:MAG: hypothetical protein APF76_17710 [Desulfitibacter sp. BRH_c19]|nr:MAG: hypothetical protein APF76_17710 [Desulfitibacter sp. BRH_c19]